MKKFNYKPDIQFIVEENNLLLEYLLLKLSNKSKNNIKSLLLHGNISINNKTTTQYNAPLHVGDVVAIKSKIYDKNHKEVLDIIYEDNELIAINKPSGLLSIATDKEKERTAYHMVIEYVKRNNPMNHIFVVHRLDRDTSGVLLLAKNEKIKHMLQDKWEELVSIRGYTAIVEGKLEEQIGTIKSWLKETNSLIVYSTNDKKNGQEAITHYKVLKENNKYTLLDIHIDTGRKNQIRVHMKDIGHSITGDKKYGSNTNPLKRLGLHAHILEFKHPITKQIICLKAEVPNEFMILFNHKTV